MPNWADETKAIAEMKAEFEKDMVNKPVGMREIIERETHWPARSESPPSISNPNAPKGPTAVV